MVAVLTGAGGHFCAGFDLKALAADGVRLSIRTAKGRWGRPAACCPSR